MALLTKPGIKVGAAVLDKGYKFLIEPHLAAHQWEQNIYSNA
jgi:hypothetical protein